MFPLNMWYWFSMLGLWCFNLSRVCGSGRLKEEAKKVGEIIIANKGVLYFIENEDPRRREKEPDTSADSEFAAAAEKPRADELDEWLCEVLPEMPEASRAALSAALRADG